jgi:hypothetical protein
MDETCFEILRMIEKGTISAEEGEMLLNALDSRPGTADRVVLEPDAGWQAASGEAETRSTGPPAWTQQVWIYPLASGVVLVGLAGMATALLVSVGVYLGWLACTMPLMALGGLVAVLAWWSQRARWVHVRVRNRGTRFRFSLPVPLRPVAWLARLARPWVPQVRDIPVDEMILALADMEDDEVLGVEVNDEGEEVQVYFG